MGIVSRNRPSVLGGVLGPFTGTNSVGGIVVFGTVFASRTINSIIHRQKLF